MRSSIVSADSQSVSSRIVTVRFCVLPVSGPNVTDFVPIL